MTLERRATLRRRSPLSRGVGIRRRNERRSKERKARNFGDEAEVVRTMLCLAWPTCCQGPVQAAHVTARGNGGAKGGRFDIVPLCTHHHTEAGEANRPGETGETKRDLFERRYRLNLRAEADRIALEHESPLGIRGLADRWASLAADDGRDRVRGFTGYDEDALLGWVRRRLAWWAKRLPYIACKPDRESLAHAVMLDLGEPFTSDPSGPHGLAWSLCEAAGWPEVDGG